MILPPEHLRQRPIAGSSPKHAAPRFATQDILKPMPAFELIILLSIGSFQVNVPAVSKQAAPTFEDSAKGVVEFVQWFKSTIPEPKFGQPPLQVCVVGALPFTLEKAPYLPKPLWESRQPLHSLEPYSATFHYVEPPKAGAKAPAREPCVTPSRSAPRRRRRNSPTASHQRASRESMCMASRKRDTML